MQGRGEALPGRFKLDDQFSSQIITVSWTIPSKVREEFPLWYKLAKMQKPVSETRDVTPQHWIFATIKATEQLVRLKCKLE